MKTIEMRKKSGDGYLFVFCGLDGCGKTTLINRLAEDLKKERKVLITKQPTEAVRTSRIFRTYMDTPDHNGYDYRSLSLLAASDRLQHSNKVIEPAVSDGTTVICDRYFYSCIANLRARGYKNDNWIYEIANCVIRPDAAFFIDVPVEIALNRVRSRENEKNRYIDVPLQYRLRSEYLDMCNSFGGILVPTDITVDESYEIVKSKVKEVMYGNG